MIAIRSLAALLTYLIGLCGIFPLFPWLTIFPRTILVVGLLAGLWQDRKKKWRISPWMQNVAIIPLFLYYVIQFSRANPVQPFITVLAILLAVRLSGEKSVRHSLQIYLLSIFCLASSSLFDLSPTFLIYLALLLFLVALSLVLLTFQDQKTNMIVSKSELKTILLYALLMPVLAVPLLLIFFPILPRTQMPLWHFMAAPSVLTTGYSDSVEPGSQSSIAASKTLAFRVEMPRLAQSQLYWRGTVFNRTNGLKWTRNVQIPSEQPEFAGSKVTQVIYPEPSTSRPLIALDRPAVLSLQRIKRSPDGVNEPVGSSGKRVSYNAESYTSGMVAQRKAINRQYYLQLPDNIPVRIQNLAAVIAGNGKDDKVKIEALEGYFRNGGFRYATTALATGDNALEQFLFDKKQGHCEFFASSFALLLRVAGVPCRLVGGYIGGDFNDLGGYYLVTEEKAHVWVEALIDGGGWVRIDPSSFAANAGDVLNVQKTLGIKQQITLVLDSFNHLWNRSVINYDFEQQINVANAVASRLQGVEPKKIIRTVVPYFVVGLAIAALFIIVSRIPNYRSREQRILKSFLRTMEDKFDIPSGEGEVGLFEIASVADNLHVSAFVTLYAGAVYCDRRLTDNEYIQLKLIIRNLQTVKPKKS
jgi:transglutaminase-like putative cysteine protease